MATESPLRLTGSGGPSNWPVINDDNVTYSSPTANVATNDLVLLLNGHRFRGERKLNAPNRCGSAPPIIESFRVPSGNLKGQQSSNRNGSFENLSNVVGSCESEEDVRAHPSYLSYYCSNINLNPRLPPPIISQENRRLVHHIGIFADDWRTLSISQTALSTHKEEPDDDKSPRVDDLGGKNNLPLSQEFKPLQGRHKSVVDLIQEDFPRTPSPVYNDLLPPSNHSTAERAADPDVAHSLHDSSAGLIPSSDAAPCHKGKSAGSNVILDNSVTPDAVSGSNINRNESVTDNLKMSNDEQSGPHAQQAKNLISQSQMVTQRMHHVNWAANHLSRGRSKSSSVEAQPVLQPTGTALPLYPTTAAYGSPYYPNIHPSALIPPPFNFGGYAINTTLTPPFITGYLPHGAVPIPFENHPGLNFDVRNSGAPGFELQHLYKFYGQLGVAIQPLMDPLYMPYSQHLSLDTYSGTGRFNAMAPGGSTIGIPPSIYDSLNQKPQILRGGFVNTPSSRQGGIIESNCYSTTPNTGASPFISPVYKGPSISGTSFSRTKMENMKPSLGSGRTPCTLSGWQGERGRSKCNGPKPNSFLEELKCSRGHRFELSDITGLVVDFSADQHGSRYIQQKLETCSIEEKMSVFNEVLPHASALMTDVFGNYVIQKFFEHGSSEQRKELANQLTGHVLPLSLQMYGCRVIQKALEVVELDKKIQLAYELDGHILRCVRDQNGNHVIQKCIECIPSEQIGFIISAFRGQVSTLSMHPYGCRVIQRVLEHCIDELQSNCIVDEILQSVSILAEDQYGNYVIQHVLERGKPQERSQIIRKLAGQVVHMSQHKFASNVIEKCLEHGDTAEQELLIEEIVGQTEGNNNLLAMMKDQFANYVIQKILETSTGEQREVLLNRIKNHLQALKKYTYGKHIVARVEQLCDQGCNVSD